MKRLAPLCPVCGGISLAQPTKYGARYSCCGLWSWDAAPLVDADTHKARKEAHEAFDVVWRGGHMTRSEAYKSLAIALGLSPPECHIKLFDAVTCARVVAFAKHVMFGKLRAEIEAIKRNSGG